MQMRKRQGKIECDLEANGANTSLLGLELKDVQETWVVEWMGFKNAMNVHTY
jgi:hypothetical protein